MKRYSETYKLLDPAGSVNQVYITSTDVFRTIQSGYSEMMGMFPPSTTLGPLLSDTEVTNLATTGLGMPPFKVRGAKEVNAAMGNVALPHGFRSI